MTSLFAEEKPRALVVGGTAGLGLEIAQILHEGYNVFVTGRGCNDLLERKIATYRAVEAPGLRYEPLYIHRTSDMAEKTRCLLIYARLDSRPIDLLVYTPGFYQPGYVVELKQEDIENMYLVGLEYPVMLVQAILDKQKTLPGFIAITSTSQWIPRPKEPVYTAVKAGLAAFAHSVSFDPAFGKVMVAAPAGMKTDFWAGTDQDTSTYLEPKWVAEQIVREYHEENLKYKFMKILRDPAKVVIDPSTRYANDKDSVKPFGFRFLSKE